MAEAMVEVLIIYFWFEGRELILLKLKSGPCGFCIRGVGDWII